MRERGNRLVSGIPKDLLVALAFLLTSTASFGLGILSGRDMLVATGVDDTFQIENVSSTTAHVLGASALATTQKFIEASAVGERTAPGVLGTYVGSKTGKKYYLPTCSGVKRIKEENKVWFNTLEEAKAGGRTPAVNCPGL